MQDIENTIICIYILFKNKWVGLTNKTFNLCHLNEVLYDKKCVSLHDHFAKCVLFDFFPYLLRKKNTFPIILFQMKRFLVY